MKRTRPETVDAYLKDFTGAQRKTLDQLRHIIRTAAPKADEGISYGMPTYKWNGVLIGFGGFTSHCSLFGMSAQLAEMAPQLKGYQTGPGTLRFEPGKKLPVTLIRKLIKGRMRQNEARAMARIRKRHA